MMRFIFAALALAVVAEAQAADPYWVCIDQQGTKVARDRPCGPGEQQVLTNQPAPKSPSQAPSANQKGATKQHPQSAADLPRAMLGGALGGLLKVLPLALFAFASLVALALLDRKIKAQRRRHLRSRANEPPKDFWRAQDGPPDSIPYDPSPRTAPLLPAARPVEWSVRVIRDLEWKRFEELVQAYWRTKGYQSELTKAGSDGGVDVLIYSPQTTRLFAVAQCKSFRADRVGVPLVRELWGVVHHHGAQLGLFYGLSGFTPDAIAFAQGKHLKLVTGEDLLQQIHTLSGEQKKAILDHVCRDDYLTPTCPTCDVKLVLRDGTGGRFWGCGNFPKCRNTMVITAHAGYS